MADVDFEATDFAAPAFPAAAVEAALPCLATAAAGAALRADLAVVAALGMVDEAAATGLAVRDAVPVPVRVAAGVRLPVPARGFEPVPEAAGLVEAFLAAGIEVFLSNDCGHDGAGRLAGCGGLRQLASPVQRASSASHSALRFSTVSSARVASSAVA
ncbi:MAG TPA: hypothetical protein VN408_40925 [Actinoplanes sp.]|nr:hypothetical protein [Actinoplanes sp.]